jgi:hypothetical protein
LTRSSETSLSATWKPASAHTWAMPSTDRRDAYPVNVHVRSLAFRAIRIMRRAMFYCERPEFTTARRYLLEALPLRSARRACPTCA